MLPSAPPTIPDVEDPNTFSPRAQAWVNWQTLELYPALAGLLVPISQVQETLTYASSVTIDCSEASTFDILLTGNITIGFDFAAYDGQKIMLRLKQDATGSRLVTFDSTVTFSADLTGFTASTLANKTDLVGLIYNLSANKFQVVATNRGY